MPPRAHGEVITDRSVSFLELFYDLVYVVVIARAAHTLAKDVTWRSVGEFAVVFGLIWLAWLNGTSYYELHGREDGRTRVFVFAQMLLLALLAVFTADAAGESGTQFAIVYVLYLAVVSWLWYTVRVQDSEEYMAVTGRYLIGMLVSIGLMLVSAIVPTAVRLWIWAALVLMWAGFGLVAARDQAMERGVTITHSMVERFGLFVIIVLGEVVVGVVDGLSEVERSFRSITTGMIGLGVGFAYWWTYFDFVGGRLPINRPRLRSAWMFLHLPVTLSIAAAGAAMVSLIEHAGDDQAPTSTAWLLGGSVALGLMALIPIMRTLRDFQRLSAIYRPLSWIMVLASALAILIAYLTPTPWLLAVGLVVVLLGVWIFAVSRWMRLNEAEAVRRRRE